MTITTRRYVVPEVAWIQPEIDGSAYMIPNYQNEFGANVVAVNETTISPLGTQGGGLLYSYLLDQKLDTIGGAPVEWEDFDYNLTGVNIINGRITSAGNSVCIELELVEEKKLSIQRMRTG